MKRSLRGALAICIAASLWGLDGVVLTPRLHNLDVLFVVFLLHLVPFVILQPFFFSSYKTLRTLSPSEWFTLALVALCGGIVGTYSIVKALFLVNFNQLSVVVLLQKLQPVFAILLAAILLNERVSKRFLAWACLAIAGAYLLTFGLTIPQTESGSSSTRAALWASLAAAAFGCSTVLGKKLLNSLDYRQATFARYGATTVFGLIALIASGLGLPIVEVTRTDWILIVAIGLTTGSGALFLYYWGLSWVPARVAAICELCLPLSAVGLDYAINGSVLGAWQWVGAAALILAILKVTLGPKPPARVVPAAT